MRTAWLDEKYIVNATRQFVGQSILSKLQAENRMNNPRVLFLILEPKLTPKLKEVGCDTLGRICAYGTSEGFHNGGPLGQTVGFMNLTGFKKVMHSDFERKKDGPDLLVEMAVATIVCVAFDIINQGNYFLRREKEHEEDELYLDHM